MIFLKLLLCGISAVLMWRQTKLENRTLAIYWELVALYWLLNALVDIGGIV